MKTTINAIAILLLINASLHAQTKKSSKPSSYQRLTVKPHFPGGPHALDSFITSHLRYPDEAREDNVEGRAGVRFIVNEDGIVSNVEIARSSGNSILDAEAMRVVERMPPWIPGSYKKRKVKVFFVLPITFKLDN